MPCVFARTPREANGRLLSDVIRVGDILYGMCNYVCDARRPNFKVKRFVPLGTAVGN